MTIAPYQDVVSSNSENNFIQEHPNRHRSAAALSHRTSIETAGQVGRMRRRDQG
jgi:hypothetical protein